MSTGSPMSLDVDTSMETPVAADVMQTNPRTCSPFSTVVEAVMIFKDADCGLVPVVDGGKPVGVVTDRDVALSLASVPDLGARPVSEIMTTNLVTVSPQTPVIEVARVFASEGVRRVLVVDDQDNLVGVIGWADVAPRLSYQVTGAMVTEVVEKP